MTFHAIRKLGKKLIRQMRVLEKQIERKLLSGTPKAARQADQKMELLGKLYDEYHRCFGEKGAHRAEAK